MQSSEVFHCRFEEFVQLMTKNQVESTAYHQLFPVLAINSLTLRLSSVLLPPLDQSALSCAQLSAPFGPCLSQSAVVTPRTRSPTRPQHSSASTSTAPAPSAARCIHLRAGDTLVHGHTGGSNFQAARGAGRGGGALRRGRSPAGAPNARRLTSAARLPPRLTAPRPPHAARAHVAPPPASPAEPHCAAGAWPGAAGREPGPDRRSPG